MYKHLRNGYGQFNHSHKKTIKSIMQKFGEIESIVDKITRVHPRGVSSAKKVAAVSHYVVENPKLSSCRHSHNSGLYYGSYMIAKLNGTIFKRLIAIIVSTSLIFRCYFWGLKTLQ